MADILDDFGLIRGILFGLASPKPYGGIIPLEIDTPLGKIGTTTLPRDLSYLYQTPTYRS